MQIPSGTPVFSRISSLEVIGLFPVVEFDHESRVDVLVLWSTVHVCQPVEVVGTVWMSHLVVHESGHRIVVA